MLNRAPVMDDMIRTAFLLVSGMAMLLLAVWYVSFCLQELTGSGQIVIDPLTIVTDDGKGSDELGKALAQMLQADLEFRASEFQNAKKNLAGSSSPPTSQATQPPSEGTQPPKLAGNVRGWTPEIPLKIFLLKPLQTRLMQSVDMKLSVGGVDVGGMLPWLQRRISSKRTLHFTLYSHGDETEVFGSIAALHIDGPALRLVVKGEDAKPPSLREVVDHLAYEIFRLKLATERSSKVYLLRPDEFVRLIRVIVHAGEANRESADGRPAKDEFLSILPDIKDLCDSVQKWPELDYFAGWIADKSSDSVTAVKYYQLVLDQRDKVKDQDLLTYLTNHVAEINAASALSASLSPDAGEPASWSIDYTQFVRAIRDGGAEGSVVGQALALAMEMQIKRTLRQEVAISPRFIYNTTRQLEGTSNFDSGALIKDAIGILSTQGAVEEAVWPYKAGGFADKPPPGVAKAPRWQIAGAQRLNGLEQIKNALAKDGPVVAGIDVYQEAMSTQAAKTGVFPLPQKASQLVGGHAIVLVAYDERRNLFKFANDWGPAWGDQGYGYLSEEYLQKHAHDSWNFKSVTHLAQSVPATRRQTTAH